MPVDILDPNYWISELFGDVLVFSVFLTFIWLYIAGKLKLNFQWTVAVLTLTFLMLPIVFEGFLSWVPLILIIIGLIVGTIFMRFLERN